MSRELTKVYEPERYEDAIYKQWEASGLFNPDICVASGVCQKNADTYTIVLPPPNITDKLHLGHVVMVAVSDILIRYNRMNGRRALWVPGTDHAAIATQNVVEKKLLKEQGKTRHDLGREKFLQEVDSFVQVTKNTIINQLKKSGASLDWSREAFTLDEARQAAVKRMFVDMYNEGVIYRGYRIVNWCPRCQSTLADDEVEHEEQKAMLYTFKYDKAFPFAISTTRPETKLGDTAVAVSPDDERYQQYIGKELKAMLCGVPLTLKIIADKHVDPDFGTGALGVTPAHSMVDYEMAQQHGLKIKKVINEDGSIAPGLGAYVMDGDNNSLPLANLNVMEARELIVQELKKNGLLEQEEAIKHNLSVCYRCGTGIEPLPSQQWFVSVDKKLQRLGGKSLKEKAIEVAKQDKIKFTPERFTKRYLDWMENLHDWCISRQIWYGHQIPAWYRPKAGPPRADKGDEIYVGAEAPAGDGWVQEGDVLDTWFSSGMWTFSTLGWPASASLRRGKPAQTDDLETYHPTSVLETGYEIITLWVSRMIMMSLFAMNDIPFEHVYLHGMILDKHGKKMSKSKGNGIDPLEMFAKYGTDATRVALIVGGTPGNDMRISEEKIADFRNFANKLWNIARYVIQQSEQSIVNSEQGKKQFKHLTLADKWILGRIDWLKHAVTTGIEGFDFSQTGEFLRNVTWNDFADWYVEVSKFEQGEQKQQILLYVLEELLKVWHPFMPFVTEAIWQEMGHQNLLMVAPWPKRNNMHDVEVSVNFDLIIDIIKAIRNVRSEYKIEPKKKIKTIIYARNKLELVQSQSALIQNLRTGISELEIMPQGPKIKNAALAFIDGEVEVYIPLTGLVDITKEKARLEKRSQELKQVIANSDKKLDNQEFVHNAPKEVVQTEIDKADGYKQELKKIKEQIKHL